MTGDGWVLVCPRDAVVAAWLAHAPAVAVLEAGAASFCVAASLALAHGLEGDGAAALDRAATEGRVACVWAEPVRTDPRRAAAGAVQLLALAALIRPRDRVII